MSLDNKDNRGRCRSINLQDSYVMRLNISPFPNNISHFLLYGPPERIRTSDLSLRRAALYPAELRAAGWGL